MRINILFGAKNMVSDAGVAITLRYYLIQDSSVDEEEKDTYGIGVVKTAEGEAEEREWLPGIFHSREEAERLLRVFIKGAVTPVSAMAVVDDWIR